jgi:hypothetical protein
MPLPLAKAVLKAPDGDVIDLAMPPRWMMIERGALAGH